MLTPVPIQDARSLSISSCDSFRQARPLETRRAALFREFPFLMPQNLFELAEVLPRFANNATPSPTFSSGLQMEPAPLRQTLLGTCHDLPLGFVTTERGDEYPDAIRSEEYRQGECGKRRARESMWRRR